MIVAGKTARLTTVAIFLGVVVSLWTVARIWLEQDEIGRLQLSATLVLHQQKRLIDSEIGKFRLLPIVLGEYGDLRDALAGASPAAASRLDAKLRSLATETGAQIIYGIDRNGNVVSASNAGTAESFVGQNYGFRPYFIQAMANGAAEYYAVGALSGRPGLFLAKRIGDDPSTFGVVVVKIEFQKIMSIWANDPGQTFVVDPRGIVLASTDPQEQSHTLKPLDDENRAQIIRSDQFHAADLTPGQYSIMPDGRMRGRDGDMFISVAEDIAASPLQLLHIERIAPALTRAGNTARLVALAATCALVAISGAIYRRMTRAARIAADRAALETAVAQRTAELTAEMVERTRADQRFRQAREELAQANRLASLGSITAGLAHEINQPVATIRTLTENARHHLASGKLERVAANLDTSIELTARIGSITQEMRRFARRGKGEIVKVSLEELLEGTLVLIGDRFRHANVKLELPGQGLPHVLADRVRLEQVVVNLLQNALDAVSGQSDPQVLLTVEDDGKQVKLMVADNGPGIDPELGEEIFSPFVTSKQEGLGLGLGIARDIMSELEATLHIAPSPLGGAAFVATVRRA